MLTNENIRNDLKEYLTKFGVKNKYIATNIGVSNTTISLFLKNKRELSPDRLEKIAELIYNK